LRTFRVGIDGRALCNINRYRGIGRYTYQLLQNLVKASEGYRFVLFGYGESPEPGLLDADVLAELEWREIPRRGRPREYPPPWEHLLYARAVQEAGLDIFHGIDHNMTPFLRCPSIITVHDLILLVLRGPYLGPKSWLWMEAHRRASKKARFVVAVSENTRRDVHRVWGIPLDRIEVVHEGVSPAYRPVRDDDAIADVLDRYGIARPFFMYLGGFDPRKNIGNMLLGFKRYLLSGPEADGFSLMLCGDAGGHEDYLEDEIGELGLGDSVRVAGFVDDEDMPALYTAAEALVFVSTYEGFGLPLLEAMACGTPVLGSGVSSIPEVVGDAGVLVDPLEPDEIAGGMRRLAGDAALRGELIDRGIRRAGLFTWEETAARIMGLYERVLEGV
jgi:glycosyltransferase involved in cell wall biosynthesis